MDEIRTGALVSAADNDGLLLVVEIYRGMYGRQMANVVCADNDASEAITTDWLRPVAYFAEELTLVA